MERTGLSVRLDVGTIIYSNVNSNENIPSPLYIAAPLSDLSTREAGLETPDIFALADAGLRANSALNIQNCQWNGSLSFNFKDINVDRVTFHR